MNILVHKAPLYPTHLMYQLFLQNQSCVKFQYLKTTDHDKAQARCLCHCVSYTDAYNTHITHSECNWQGYRQCMPIYPKLANHLNSSTVLLSPMNTCLTPGLQESQYSRSQVQMFPFFFISSTFQWIRNLSAFACLSYQISLDRYNGICQIGHVCKGGIKCFQKRTILITKFLHQPTYN